PGVGVAPGKRNHCTASKLSTTRPTILPAFTSVAKNSCSMLSSPLIQNTVRLEAKTIKSLQAVLSSAYCVSFYCLSEAVIPACFKRESRRVRIWTPDKGIRGDAFRTKLALRFLAKQTLRLFSTLL